MPSTAHRHSGELTRYVDSLQSRYDEIEESINNATEMLMRFVTDCKSLQDDIDAEFHLFETKLRQKKRYIMKELSDYQHETLTIIKDHISKLQLNKKSISLSQKQQQNLIHDDTLNSKQKLFKLQQLTEYTINDSFFKEIPEHKCEFIVHSDVICDVISNIGTWIMSQTEMPANMNDLESQTSIEEYEKEKEIEIKQIELNQNKIWIRILK